MYFTDKSNEETLFKERIMKLFIFTIIAIYFFSPLVNAENFKLPELPETSLENINNEIEQISEKDRGPSNSTEEDQYSPPPEEVKIWEYERILDRHDKH